MISASKTIDMVATTKTKPPRQNWQQKLADALRDDPEIPAFVEEWRGIPGRQFRFDIAWPQFSVVVEMDGGTWIPGGGHSSGAGIRKGYEKLRLAQMHGLTYLPYTSDEVKEAKRLAQTIAQIKEALAMARVPARMLAILKERNEARV